MMPRELVTELRARVMERGPATSGARGCRAGIYAGERGRHTGRMREHPVRTNAGVCGLSYISGLPGGPRWGL